MEIYAIKISHDHISMVLAIVHAFVVALVRELFGSKLETADNAGLRPRSDRDYRMFELALDYSAYRRRSTGLKTSPTEVIRFF